MAVNTTLSVVVVACDGPGALRRLLGDLAAQRGAPAFETIVVDTTGAVTADHLAGAPADEKRLLAAVGADVAVARAMGVREAHGDLVAFTEDHCQLPHDWCATLVRTRAAGHMAFGGPIEIGSHRSPADWAAFLVEFGAFMPPLRPGRADSLPGMNAAYARGLLMGVLDGALCEPIVNGRLQRQGVGLHIEPTLTVAFERRFSVGDFMRHCFASGRAYARLRLAHAPGAARIGFGLLTMTALPIVLSARICARALGRRCPIIRALPWLLVYTAAWSLGEAVGAISTRTEPSQRPASVPAVLG